MIEWLTCTFVGQWQVTVCINVLMDFTEHTQTLITKFECHQQQGAQLLGASLGVKLGF